LVHPTGAWSCFHNAVCLNTVYTVAKHRHAVTDKPVHRIKHTHFDDYRTVPTAPSAPSRRSSRLAEPTIHARSCTHRSCSLRTAGSAWARPRLPTLQCSGAVVSPLRIAEPTTRARISLVGSCSSAPWVSAAWARPHHTLHQVSRASLMSSRRSADHRGAGRVRLGIRGRQ
jgi:hypothetical protein